MTMKDIPDETNPYMAWSIDRLIDFRSSFVNSIIRDNYSTVERMKVQRLGYDINHSLYHNMLSELSKLEWPNNADLLDNYLDFVVDPDNIQDFVDMMSFNGIKELSTDIDQWASWEMDMFQKLAEGLGLFAPEIEKLKEIYPKVYKKLLENEIRIGITDSS